MVVTNQVVLDLDGLAHQDRFVNPAEMYLVIPLVTILSTDGVITKNNDFAVGFKNVYHSLITKLNTKILFNNLQLMLINMKHLK